MFSIILISYNQEDYILRTLESVRYQIEKYGNGRAYQLILADDCSKDRTRELIDFWLSKYGHLLTDVVKSYQNPNVGTCKNLSDAIRLIKGDFFYVIGGDDVFADVDAYTEIESQKDFDVLASLRLVAIDDKLSKKRSLYKDVIAQVLYTSKYISWSVGLGCPGQVGMTWNKRFNTERLLNWMERYRLMEDRARYYEIWHFEGPIEYKLLRKPIIIYCRNAKSVSSLVGHHVDRLRDDLEKFYRDVYDNSDSFTYRIAVWFQIQSAKLRGKGLLSGLRYLTPYYFVEQGKRLIHSVKMRDAYTKLMDEFFDNNSAFLERMNLQAKELLDEIKEIKSK